MEKAAMSKGCFQCGSTEVAQVDPEINITPDEGTPFPTRAKATLCLACDLFNTGFRRRL